MRIKAKDRGIVGLGDKSFADLYKERAPLYKKWADVVISPEDKPLDNIVEEIRQSVTSLVIH